MIRRKKNFRRNDNLEVLLNELSELLSPVENEITQHYDSPQFPTVLLVGCARSGSTLFSQWLANTGEFAYPTNFLSRFYAAPYIGAKIQEMLTNPKYRYRDEFLDFGNPINFDSELGKTSGVLAPNEFYYFWRRFFNYGEIQHLDDAALELIDTQIFCAELAAIEAVFEKPLAMKGMIINWNIPFVFSMLPQVLFLHIKRNPVYNAQSLLEARDKFLGNRTKWYSFKPPEYPELENLDAYEQVAGQVYYTNLAIEEGLRCINSSSWMTINYEDFCQSPEMVYMEIRKKLAIHGVDVSPSYKGPEHFVNTNHMRLTSDEISLITKAYKNFSGIEM